MLPTTATLLSGGIDLPKTSRPRVLNYQVNDICNARCVMCFIWQQKPRKDLSPVEFGRLLSGWYFQKLEHIGFTGGEPTLRADLSDYYLEALDAVPTLKGLSFITNGFSTHRAMTHYGRSAELCKERGVHFSGMVSIDGVGAVHDRVRGRSGAFMRATRTLDALREQGIEVVACCTIVKENIFDIENVLEWGLERNIYVRFRMSEFISRLYNSPATAQIGSYDLPELKHLVSFYHYLLQSYEQSPAVRRTYRSILSRLTGGPRLTRCPYQTPNAMNLDSSGRFAVCAPKGTPHSLGSMAAVSVVLASRERQQILREHCETCIHDYHDEWREGVAQEEARLHEAMHMMRSHAPVPEGAPDRAHAPRELRALERVLLIGWYGTETAGDIAILAGIISEYLEQNPLLQFTLLSLFPTYTRLTLRDLPAHFQERIELLPYGAVVTKDLPARCDAVVMAGGPLMDIEETRLVSYIFEQFANLGKQCIIEGCGIGPLRREGPRNAVANAAMMASCISVRDHNSAEQLRQLGITKPIETRADPSTRFIRESRIVRNGSGTSTIWCFLRSLTWEYVQEFGPEAFEDNMVAFLDKLAEWYPESDLVLAPMHYFPIGFDDRVFARQLSKRLSIGDRLRVVRRPMSPQEILSAMSEARFSICVRFHSVVFASELNVPFVAIDYTGGGKIAGFLSDRGLESAMIAPNRLGQVNKGMLEKCLEASLARGPA